MHKHAYKFTYIHTGNPTPGYFQQFIFQTGVDFQSHTFTYPLTSTLVADQYHRYCTEKELGKAWGELLLRYMEFLRSLFDVLLDLGFLLLSPRIFQCFLPLLHTANSVSGANKSLKCFCLKKLSWQHVATRSNAAGSDPHQDRTSKLITNSNHKISTML